MTARTRAYILLIIVAVIWGIAPPLIKYSLPYFPTAVFLTYRFLIICLLMIPVLLVRERSTWHILGSLHLQDWLVLIISGLVGSTVQLGLLFWGLEMTTSLDASIINAVSPVLVALAGHYILRENIPFREKVGHIIAFIGTMVIIIQPLFEGHKLFSGSILGNLLTFLGTVSWVVYVLLTKRELQHKLSPLLLTAFMFFAGFISMSVICFFLYTPYAIGTLFYQAPLIAHLGVIYMALLSGALAYWAYQEAQKVITVAEANIFLYLPPLFTLPLAYFWLHEKITLFFILGSLIIAFGVIFAEVRKTRRSHVV